MVDIMSLIKRVNTPPIFLPHGERLVTSPARDSICTHPLFIRL
jgi:hypothetical protein